MFHRVDDPMGLPSSRYFRMAERLHLRGGAVAHARAAAHPAPPLTLPAAIPAQTVAHMDPATLAALSDNPGFPGIEYTPGG